MFLSLLAVLALGPVVSTSPAAEARGACTAIEALPYSIRTSGNYCLFRELTTDQADGSAITIEADGVTLDLNGFGITNLAGPATGAFGIQAQGRHHVTIRNGRVAGFLGGIEIQEEPQQPGPGGHLIERIHAVDNTSVGIHVQGEGSRVRFNRVDSAAGRGPLAPALMVGLSVEGDRAETMDNDVMLTTNVGTICINGIQAGGGSAVIRGNRVSGSRGECSYGIRVTGGDDVRVLDNRLVAVGVGVAYEGASGSYDRNILAGTARGYEGGMDGSANR